MHNLPYNSDGGNKNSFGLAWITSMMGAAARVDIVAFTEALDPIRLHVPGIDLSNTAAALYN
jgi:hypothetical protein